MYTKVTDGNATHYSIYQLQLDNPQTSFPEQMTDELLSQFSVYPLKTLPQPAFNPKTHYLAQSQIYEVEGKWQCHYETKPLPESQAANNIRSERSTLLQESDWVVSFAYERGEPVAQEWIDYRQQLRDIPLQSGFPFEIIMPVKPR